MKRFLLFTFFILPAAFMPSSLLIAFDFGLVLDQSIGVGGTGNDSDFDYSGLIVPRVSGLIGDNGDFYISAGAEIDYKEDLTFTPASSMPKCNKLEQVGG